MRLYVRISLCPSVVDDETDENVNELIFSVAPIHSSREEPGGVVVES